MQKSFCKIPKIAKKSKYAGIKHLDFDIQMQLYLSVKTSESIFDSVWNLGVFYHGSIICCTNPKVGGSSPPQVETFFSQRHLHSHKSTRSCVNNECCCPRTVNISNINFTSKISIPPGPVFNKWDSKCLALKSQMVRAFGMNPKVGCSSPPQVETFSVSKTLTLSQEHPFVCRKWMLFPAHS